MVQYNQVNSAMYTWCSIIKLTQLCTLVAV